MTILGNINELTDLLIFVLWIFYTMTFMAVIILRKKRPDLKRPYIVQLKGGIIKALYNREL